jgi:hypothetical protein
MALTLTVKAGVRGTQTNPLDLGTADFPFDVLASVALASGTGANQADVIFTDTRTLTASATENLDLAGVLTNAFGATVTMARVKAILIKAASGNTNDVQLTRPATNGVPLFLAASDGLPIRPGGFFAWCAPDATAIAVTGATGDILTVTNSAGSTSVTYDVVIVGASS